MKNQQAKSFCVPIGSWRPVLISTDENKQHQFPEISEVTERKKSRQQRLGDISF